MKIIFIARQENLFEQFAFPHFEISEDYRIIDQVLEDEDIVMELAKDIPDTDTGRNRMPAEQTLRLLILKHQKGLSYRELERTLKENLADRWFCKMNSKAPCFKTIQNQLSLISDETLHAINDQVMLEARKRKLTKGQKLRVDSTITEANIHYPTDSSLIADSIRVIVRQVRKLTSGAPKGFRTFKRKVKQQIKHIRTFGRRDKEARDKAIRELIKMGKHVSKKVKNVKDAAVRSYKTLLDRIIEQTETVLKGQSPKNRVVSIFEPEARPFRKGKAGIICEFGSEVQVQEDEHFITHWEINEKPSDTAFFQRAVDKHTDLYSKPPSMAATDRGYWSPENYEHAKLHNIKHISMPKKGKLNHEEKQRQSTRHFKKGQRFRAGGEAKISLLKRVYGLRTSLYKGEEGMKRWVGAGIIACNLKTLARLAMA